MTDANLEQLVLRSIWELLMQSVLQHFGDEPHPVSEIKHTDAVTQARGGHWKKNAIQTAMLGATYGIFSTETIMADRNLSVIVFMFLMEASSLVLTSSWLMACSGVTS